MPRSDQSTPAEEPPEPSRTPAENVAWAQELLAGLRHRFALILNDRHERKVSGVDQFYGFGLLNALRDTLKELKEQLRG